MPREKELFYPTLERIRATADRMFPDKIVYKQEEAAKIMGVSVTTLWRKGLTGGEITCEQLGGGLGCQGAYPVLPAPPPRPRRGAKPYLQGGTARIYTACAGRLAGDRPRKLGHASGSCNAGAWAGTGACRDRGIHSCKRGG